MEGHKFWDTQLVSNKDRRTIVKLEDSLEFVGDSPAQLPEGFVWDTIDIKDSVEELYKFLNENYVEGDLYKFKYTKEFLSWALGSPKASVSWNVCVRVKSSNKLIGFVSGIPMELNLGKFVWITFLCVHKKLRSKRLAPVLIHEVSRRIVVEKIIYAIFTAGSIFSTPVSETRYHHRFLNPLKLVEIGFCKPTGKMTTSRLIKLNKLPDKPITEGFRLIKSEDVGQIRQILNNYLEKLAISINFSEEEVFHWFYQNSIVKAYVVEKFGKITDFGSFYITEDEVVSSSKHKILRVGHMFYTVSTQTPLTQFVKDLLIMASTFQVDVFNSLDVMNYREFFEELRFTTGTGTLNYYLFNYSHPTIPREQMGVLMF